jgi:hypothetical protein
MHLTTRDDACTSLIEDDRMVTGQPVAGSRRRDDRAREHAQEPDEATAHQLSARLSASLAVPLKSCLSARHASKHSASL